MKNKKTEANKRNRQRGLAPATCYAAPCDSCQKPSAWEVVRTGLNPVELNLCEDCYKTKAGLMEMVAYPDTVKWKRHNGDLSHSPPKTEKGKI
jgi:hypothetical protein